MDGSAFTHFNKILKEKILEIRRQLEKLKDVDELLGKDVTEQKKIELLNTIFALQEVQQTLVEDYQACGS